MSSKNKVSISQAIWRRSLLCGVAIAGCLVVGLNFAPTAQSQQAPAPGSLSRSVDAVQRINGTSITLMTDSGSELNAIFQDSTKMVRTAPGQKDLTGATPIQLKDLQVGDRMLVRGSPADDGKSVNVALAIVMSHSDIAQKQQIDRDDWQKRGVAGLVKSVDPGAGVITISLTSFSGSKALMVRTSKSTIVRRYAPDSVKFDDAKPGAIDQIKAGDQLRARGTRNAEGTELNADEIVSGLFRNIAGTVVSTNPGANSLTVTDLVTKKPVTVKLGSDSQFRKLPPMVAQRLAARLKGGTAGESASPGNSGGEGGGSRRSEVAAGSSAENSGLRQSGGASGQGGGMRSGPPDFQQMLSRMPTVNLADLQKGDAVMIVATEGSATSDPTVITLLTGVEPILTAPNGERAASLLSPWNLGGGGGGDAGNP